ncbi:cytochrome c biogenesis protein CcsA [Marinitoga litoralis]|uniref:cytochrome c biogenesis protein CcsA n=1 Tax=Marinitoga litoralis TaxID=570855 RepID=UPI00195FBF11|nr:cytochrome c biogenesis protein CcsA [Marinitoga litoralis]MBM7559242.1 ABC-type transport system involved in cytochrome c biogenesis permease subunit [Marinitoga litoralis]
MSDITFYSLSFFIYLISLIFSIISLFSKKDMFTKYSVYLLLLAGIVETPGLILRGIQMKFFPITSTFEAVTFIAWIGTFVVFYFYKKYNIDKQIVFISILVLTAFFAISSSPLASSDINPPVPALQSYWLVLHVTFAFIGEVFFIISFASAIVYLFTKDYNKKNKFDNITYKSILIGFPFFTLGALIFGAIWAKYSWGRFWSWDPKETWSLITWFFYAGYLHSRYIMSWKGKKSVILAIIAFFIMIFTFFGVNYLLYGLHSYA